MSTVRKLNIESEWQKKLKLFNKQKMTEPLFLTTYLTPEDAEHLLESNSHNRTLALSMVNRLANAMDQGEWGVNGETIKITPHGELLDGQHRLQAIIQHGQPVRMSVALGIEFKLFAVTDTGRSRNAGDILKIAGYKNTNANAAALNLLLRYQEDESFCGRPTHRPKTVLTAMERYPHIQSFVATSNNLSYVISASTTQFMMYVLQTIDPDKAYSFFGKIQTGEGLKKNSPILAFRNLHLKMRAKKLRLDSRHLMASYILTWNAYYEGQTLTSPKWDGKEFPVITGVNRKALFTRYSGFGKYS